MTNSFPNKIDILFINCHIATMADEQLGIIKNGALAVTGDSIAWIGKETELPTDYKNRITDQTQLVDCKQKWVLPGFVDCHTHLVWAGTRNNEFQMRLNGISYEEIQKQGGGILSTVNATRKASHQKLFNLSAKRLSILMSQGITTIEIKSGYGLDIEAELKMLDVIKMLDNVYPAHIEATFLGAHTLPSEFKNRPNEYINLVVKNMLPAVKAQNIATAVDVFCEKIAFDLPQTKKIFQAAQELGFNLKLHAEQLSDSNGAGLAAEMGALSCDHLEYLSNKDANKMAQNGVTAVLLPGAYYYLNQTQRPPVHLFRERNIPMALATDLNPGSSPVFSMTLILNMACNLFGLTCEEALLGATINGAKALGLEKTKGSLAPGNDADLVLWDIQDPVDLCYMAGFSPVEKTMINGKFLNKIDKNTI